jgi:hypothetical protein
MPEKTPYSELKEAIAKLENEQAIQKQVLRDQFKTTYENLNPLNLIKNSISKFAESPEVKNNLVNIVVALTTGIISKRLIAGKRGETPLRKAGVAILSGLNAYIAGNPEVIRSVSQYLVGLFYKKKLKTDTTDQSPDDQ